MKIMLANDLFAGAVKPNASGHLIAARCHVSAVGRDDSLVFWIAAARIDFSRDSDEGLVNSHCCRSVRESWFLSADPRD